MSTLFHYLAVIGWVWCVIAIVAIVILVKRKQRMESLAASEVLAQPVDDVAHDESHAK